MHEPAGARDRARGRRSPRPSSPCSSPDSASSTPARPAAPWPSPPRRSWSSPWSPGVALRMDRIELLGLVLNPIVLEPSSSLNLVVLVYRLVAIVDAYRVAEYLNAARGLGRRPRRPGAAPRATRCRSPACWRSCWSWPAATSSSPATTCWRWTSSTATASSSATSRPATATSTPAPSPGASATPSATDGRRLGRADRPPDPEPTPVGSARARTSSIPPWDGKERLNILLIGADQRPGEGTYNTDTLIVVSIDPVDQAGRDVQPAARHGRRADPAGTRPAGLRAGLRRQDQRAGSPRPQARRPVPGQPSGRAATTALKAIIGNLYGLDIKYFVEVNFDGFKKVVDAMGGVTINVQVPVSDDRFPGDNGSLRRVYIPSGIQHMNGAEALRYARSRHGSTDFDRGPRQQRVLLSLREQADPQDADPAPAGARSPRSRRRSRRTSRSTSCATLLGPRLAGRHQEHPLVRLRAAALPDRNTCPSPRGYIIIPNISKIRAAVKRRVHDRPGRRGAAPERWPRRAPACGSSTAPATTAAGRDLAGYLDYHGLAASAPRQRPSGPVPADTTIVVYNGAEADKLPETIAYLEKTFGVTAERRGPTRRSGRTSSSRSASRRTATAAERRRLGAADAAAVRGPYSMGVSQWAYSGSRPRTASK